MRRLLVSLLVLLAVFLGTDRVAALLVGRAVAAELQASGGLAATPTVRIGGFPFLAQAFAGRYDRVEVSAGPETRDGVRVQELDVVVTGARVPLSDAVSNGITDVPVDGLTAGVRVTYADLVGDRGFTVTPTEDGVRVTGTVRVLGQQVRATATSAVRLAGNDIVVTARSLAVQGQSSPQLLAALAGLLDLRVPVGTLPYGLELTGLSVRADGLRLTARSGETVLTAP